MNKTIIKSSLLLFLLSLSSTIFSQNLSISSTAGTAPSSNAVLDLNTSNSNNRGLIIPNVTLGAALTTFSPPIANAATSKDVGMIVYNSVSTHQPVGYYYWNGTTWVSTSGASISWSLTGNSGTSAGTNYVGTNDGNALEFKADGQEAGWIDYNSSIANTFFGYQAGSSVTSNGTDNTAIGYQALEHTTSGHQNTAFGYQSLQFNTSANNNTGLGYNALVDNTTGTTNTATGAHALEDNTTGSSNTANGMEALRNNSGSFNSAFGDTVLYSNTSGYGNTAIGYASLLANTTGTYNTAIGYKTNVSSSGLTNTTAIGYSVTVSNSNMTELGNSSVIFTGINGAAYSSSYALRVGTSTSNGDGAYLTTGGTWTNVSNRNLKENFSVPNGEEILTKICTLPLFRWNYKNEPATVQHIGPMAQDFYRIFHVGNDSLSISTIDPAGIALVGVQELNKKLEVENAALKAQISQLKQLAQKQDERSTNDEKSITELKVLIGSMNQAQASIK